MLALSRRLLLAAVSLAIPLLLLGGCSGNGQGPVTPIPILTQEESDEIAQQAGVMLAADYGGWMFEVHSTIEAMPQGVPQPFRRAPAGVERDTTVASGGISYDINYQYRLGSGDLAAVWDTAAVGVESLSNAFGTLIAPAERHNGEYRHHGTFDVDGIHAEFDTLSFSGLLEDTSLATIRNFVSQEVKYYFMDAFIDYIFEIYKNPATNRYPIGGECTFTIDCDRLGSLDRNDTKRNLLVECSIGFDGTATPLMTVVEDPGDPRTIFHYRVNLDDGTVVRAP